MLSKSVKQAIVLLFMTLVFFLGVHFWLTDKKGVLQTVYPLPASFSELTIKCDGRAPFWLKDMMRDGLWELKALSSQIAYINSDGKLHHCESGWQRRSLFSERTSKNSRYRYGSLTKPITSAAILLSVEKGILSLDTSFLSLLSGGGFEKKSQVSPQGKLSVEALMRHESGVVGEIFVEKKKPWCPYQMTELGRVKFHTLEAGKHEYSNLGYCILGEVISRKLNGDYRTIVSDMFDFYSLGIRFAGEQGFPDEVWHDYRFHDFYGPSVLPEFDYYAVSSTAGMTGSATAYALLMRDILARDIADFLGTDSDRCNFYQIRQCYGNAFYQYIAPNGDSFNVKEGYMPGSSGVVVINDDKEIFVWLGNSDTLNARDGERMKNFIDVLARGPF
ncbi:serine hydrolase domain-containing protein [Microbulbifer halophilus]|uniref:Serine hydrolase domain-containing protein n=1 Tax=Microbulbifer halophilus TaxID=453963 RepID=A0ABW5E6Q6_9GAMM|nr:serine hydrolase domain-containing protein [Microbulbifer halophilus]MCW8125642.1 serine hydrolase [Microbulbifer halophilus]